MKGKTRFLSILTVLALALWGCGDDDDNSHRFAGSGSNSGETEDIDAPEIEFDETPLDEGTESVPTSDNDYVENSSFEGTIYINYDGETAAASGDTDMVTLSIDGAHVTATATSKMAYVLAGESEDGSFKVYSGNKMKVTLNGLTLTNPTGAAINDQCKKSLYIVLADETENILTDGSTYDVPEDEDMKGTIFSEGQIIFSGGGKLDVYANGKNGIASDDYIVMRPGNVINVTSTAGHGIKANDGVYVRGGVHNIGVSAEGAKGINSEGQVCIEGGRTTIITTGTAELEDREATGAAGIKSDSLFKMTDGELNIKSTGQGGKGINCDANVEIDGGIVNIVTTGKEYTGGDGSAAKGIRAEGNIDIGGGEIYVTCSGGDNSEGIESKSVLTISGGAIIATTYDDALNAAEQITIKGGNIYAYSTEDDAIDSNGALYVSGGLILANGTTTPEGPFDCDNNTFSITGGTIVGIGGTTSTPSTSSTTQPVILLGQQSYTKDTYLALESASDENIFTFKIPRTYSSAVLIVSSPDLSVGESYSFVTDVSVSGGSWWQGFSDDATTSGGSTLKTVNLSSTIVSSGTSSGNSGGNGGGGGMGGGFGGGWW